jgi:triosephosphate isomerase
MRRQLVIGNWKMNTSIDEAINLIVDLKEGLNDESTVVCVPYTHIGVVQEIVDDRIAVGAQNLCQFDNGAYTGEISSTMLQSLDVEFVIVGHSERRAYFGETDSMVNTKVQQALQKDIIPVICCGEQLETRKEGSFLPFIENQIREALKNLSKAMVANCVIAYEPVWAIGTGETASAEQAQEVHRFIRGIIENLYDKSTADHMTIVYGGSVKAENAADLFKEEDVDGALVGGASLKANDFLSIIKAL